MKERLKKFIYIIILILSATLFGATSANDTLENDNSNEGSGVVNEIITDNPEREVTTVESQKLRDKATLSLTVTKVEPMAILGNYKDGVVTTFIPLGTKQTRDIKDLSNYKLLVEGVTGEKNNDKFRINKNARLTEQQIKELFAESTQKKEEKKYTIKKLGTDLKVTVENVEKDEDIYISIVRGDKVVKAYKVGRIEGRADANSCYGQKGDTIKFRNDTNSYVYDNNKKIVFYETGKIGKILTSSDGKLNTTEFMTGYEGNKGVSQIKFSEDYEKPNVAKLLNEFYDLDPEGKPSFQMDGDLTFNPIISSAPFNIKGGNVSRKDNEFSTYTHLSGISDRPYGEGNDTRESFVNTTDYIVTEQSTDGCDPYYLKQGGGLMMSLERLKFNVKNPQISFGKYITLPGTYYFPVKFDIYRRNRDLDGNYYSNTETKHPMEMRIVTDVVDDVKRDVLKIAEKDKETIFNLGDYYRSEVSFIHKGTKKAGTGLYYSLNGESNWTQIQPGNSFTVTNNGVSATITITQKDKEKAVEIKASTPKGVTEKGGLLGFTLKQQRKDSKGNEIVHRKVQVTLVYPGESQTDTTLVELDPRLKQFEKYWLATNNGKIGTNSSNSSTGGDFSKFIKTSGGNTSKNIDTSKLIFEKMEYMKEVSGYRIFGKSSANGADLEEELGVKKGTITSAQLGANLNKRLDKNNEKRVIYAEKDNNNNIKNYGEIKFKYKAGTLTRANSNTDYYTGSGDIDLSTLAQNKKVFFNTTSTNKTSKGIFADGTESSVSINNISEQVPNGLSIFSENEVVANLIEVVNTNTQEKIELDLRTKNMSKTLDGFIFGLNTDTKINGITKGGLTLEKTPSAKLIEAGQKYEIKYSYSVQSNGETLKLILGTFTLNIKNKDLGVALKPINFTIDRRISQITSGNWLYGNGKLKGRNGNNEVEIGDYSPFVKVDFGAKQEASVLAENVNMDSVKIVKVEKINGNTPSKSFNDKNGVKYDYSSGNGNNNEIALPSDATSNKVTLADYQSNLKDTPLVVSKKDVTGVPIPDGGVKVSNNYTIQGKDSKGAITNYTGTINESYVGKGMYNGGQGTLDLTNGKVGETYTYAPGITPKKVAQRDAEKAPELKVTKERSIDGRSVINNAENNNLINKIIITKLSKAEGEGNNSQTITSTNIANGITPTELKISGLNSIKLGISTVGGMIVEKSSDQQIDNIKIKIEYFYSPNINGSDEATRIKLGDFTLTLNNDVASKIQNKGSFTFEVDPRINQLKKNSGDLWIARDSINTTPFGAGEYEKMIVAINNIENAEASKVFNVGTEKSTEEKPEGANYTLYKNNNKNIAAIKDKKDKSQNKTTDLLTHTAFPALDLTTTDKSVRTTENDKSTTVPIVVTNSDETSYYRVDGNLKYVLKKDGVDIPVDGYTGSGNIDLTGVKVGDELEYSKYDFNHSSQITGKPELTGNGVFIDTFGVVQAQQQRNIGKWFRVSLINGQLLSNTNTAETDIIDVTENSGKVSVVVGNKYEIGVYVDEIRAKEKTVILKVVKLEDTNVESDKLKIEYFYDEEKTVKLGEFNLVLTNKRSNINIGTAKFKLDDRLVKHIANSDSKWYIADGAVVNSTKGRNTVNEYVYKNFIKFEEFNRNDRPMPLSTDPNLITKVKIDDVELKDENKISLLGTNYYANGELAIPLVETDQIGFSTAITTKNLTSTKDSKVEIQSTNEWLSGTITREIVKNYHDSKATLDLSGVAKNVKGHWDSESTGAESGTSSNMKLTFTNGEKLFKLDSLTGENLAVTHYKVFLGNGKANSEYIAVDNTDGVSLNLNEKTVNDGEFKNTSKKEETIKRVETNDIKIRIGKEKETSKSEGKARLEITKLTHEIIEEKEIVIIPYAKLEGREEYIELGKLTLKVTNKAESLGEVTYKIDKRIVSGYDGFVKNGDTYLNGYNWLFLDGKGVTDTTDGATSENSKIDFSDFTSVTGSLNQTKGATTYTGVNLEGRDSKVSQSGANKYYKFKVNESSYANEGALVKSGNFSDLNSKVIISKFDITQPKENVFVLVGNDNKLYRGVIKEEYITPTKIKGKGKIEHLDRGVTYTFPAGAQNNVEGTADEKNKIILQVENGGYTPSAYGEDSLGSEDKIIANHIEVTYKNNSRW